MARAGFPEKQEERHSPAHQHRPHPFHGAEVLLVDHVGGGEGEQQIRRQERFHPYQFRFPERGRTEDLAAEHQADPDEPQRCADEVQQQAGMQYLFQRLPIRDVLLGDEAQPEKARRTQADHDDHQRRPSPMSGSTARAQEQGILPVLITSTRSPAWVRPRAPGEQASTHPFLERRLHI